MARKLFTRSFCSYFALSSSLAVWFYYSSSTSSPLHLRVFFCLFFASSLFCFRPFGRRGSLFHAHLDNLRIYIVCFNEFSLCSSSSEFLSKMRSSSSCFALFISYDIPHAATFSRPTFYLLRTKFLKLSRKVFSLSFTCISQVDNGRFLKNVSQTCLKRLSSWPCLVRCALCSATARTRIDLCIDMKVNFRNFFVG